jgi:hypothetical protein
MPYGWGTGGVQVTAAIIGPDDVLKVIDQGADDTTNAVSIRAFFQKVADVAVTTHTAESDHHPDPPPYPEQPLTEGTDPGLPGADPEPLRFLEPRETETRKMHALEEYGLMHVKLYEDIALMAGSRRPTPIRSRSRAAMSWTRRRRRNSTIRRCTCRRAAALRRRPREAHLCDPALYRGRQPRFRGPPLRDPELRQALRTLRRRECLSRRGRSSTTRAGGCSSARTRIIARNAAHGEMAAAMRGDEMLARHQEAAQNEPKHRSRMELRVREVSKFYGERGLQGGSPSSCGRARCWRSSANPAPARRRC